MAARSVASLFAPAIANARRSAVPASSAARRLTAARSYATQSEHSVSNVYWGSVKCIGNIVLTFTPIDDGARGPQHRYGGGDDS